MMNKTKPRILVIDDDLSILDCIRLSLKQERAYSIEVSQDPEIALQMVYDRDFAVVISDLTMPHLSGLDVLKAVREYDEKIPVILITGSSDENAMRRAIHLGVYEFLKKPFEISDLIVTVQQAVEANQLRIQNDLYKRKLKSLVIERTAELMEIRGKLENSYLNTIHVMVNAMEANDVYTRGHSERVTAIAVGLGKVLGLSLKELRELRIGALLHDLGKIGVISNVLSKPQSLTDTEFDIIKQHPITGAKIIEPIGLPESVTKIILQHHEWYNGEGYPYQQKGEDIHLFARIVSVADSFDAMTSQRLYRDKLDFERAAQEIKNNLELQFDPVIGKIFYDNIDLVLSSLKGEISLNDLLEEAF